MFSILLDCSENNMNRLFNSLMILFLPILSYCQYSVDEIIGEWYGTRIIRVTDGDTLDATQLDGNVVNLFQLEFDKLGVVKMIKQGRETTGIFFINNNRLVLGNMEYKLKQLSAEKMIFSRRILTSEQVYYFRKMKEPN